MVDMTTTIMDAIADVKSPLQVIAEARPITPETNKGPNMPECGPIDEMSLRLRREAREIQNEEPEISSLLELTVLAPGVETFEDAVASTLVYRLLVPPSCPVQRNGQDTPVVFSPEKLKELIQMAMSSRILEHGSTMSEAIRRDALAFVERDPAMDSFLEVVLFAKGYASLVCHHAAYRLWGMKKKFTALFLQSQCSAIFGLDIHPLSRIGTGVMFDHGTGVVVGETATIGDGCTILHGVTLGGTGKKHGDRHPKVGKNVLIGAGSLLLGNIQVGDCAKIGAGSVLLRSIPPFATAVGVPAKVRHFICFQFHLKIYLLLIRIFPPTQIVGRATEVQPGSEIDQSFRQVSLLRRQVSSITERTESFSDYSLSEAFSESSLTDQEEDVPSTRKSDNKKVDALDPFRDYHILAKKAPPGTVTIVTMKNLFKLENLSSTEVGACFFELDTRGVGFISTEEFLERAPEVIKKCTGLAEERIRQVIEDISVHLHV